MADLTRADVIYKANVLIRDRCNSGISWGTNNYPAGSQPSWFGGTTAGKFPSIGLNSGAASSSQIVSTLQGFAGHFASIRRTRIVIYKNMNGYEPKRPNVNSTHAWTSVIYDATAIAHLASDAAGATPGNHYVTANNHATGWSIDDLCNKLYNSYVNNSRYTTATLSNNVCHYNCHNNCHDSRHRR